MWLRILACHCMFKFCDYQDSVLYTTFLQAIKKREEQQEHQKTDDEEAADDIPDGECNSLYSVLGYILREV